MALLNLLKRSKKWDLETGHIVEYKFTSTNGKNYALKDTFNTYCKRALEALDVYENWGLNKTKEQDRTDWQRVLDICNRQPIMLTEIVQLAQLNLENSEMILPPEEIIWKMASVMYFDESESPYSYDEKYNEQKIALWKKDKKLDFFLSRQLIGSLIPLPDLSETVLKDYLEVARKVRAKQEELKSALSE